MKLFRSIAAGAVACVLLLTVALLVYIKREAHGFSARAEPTRMEATLTRAARNAAIPVTAKRMQNPVPLTPAVLHDGMAHFADHCAICHGNNGNGQTMLGGGMYPRPPDLRARTQRLSDGELFYYIENGIRMSGMPAFGSPGTEDDSWKLVHFIRHLPVLTAEEQAEMEHLNPKSPDELKEEQDEEQFLNGSGSSAQPATQYSAKGHTI